MRATDDLCGIYILICIPLLTINMSKLSVKSKLDDYQARKNKGERLNQDQLVCAVYSIQF